MSREEVNHSPVAGYGSKYKACKQAGLHLYLPEFHSVKQVYIEPFCFSAVVFFNTKARCVILNDKDDYIYNFWNVIKSRYNEFVKELEFVWIGKKWFEEYQEREDDVGKAIFYYLCNKNNYAGIFSGKFKYKYYVRYLNKNLNYWKKRMDNTTSLTIWNLDFHDLYEKLINKGGDRNSFIFYVDPPYLMQGKHYHVQMSIQDHEDLLQYHEQLRLQDNTFILISYDDCEKTREMYDGWYIKEISFSSVAFARKANNYNEILISNKPFNKKTITKNKRMF